jgi:flagellar biosynthesis GTPase FlhF
MSDRKKKRPEEEENEEEEEEEEPVEEEEPEEEEETPEEEEPEEEEPEEEETPEEEEPVEEEEPEEEPKKPLRRDQTLGDRTVEILRSEILTKKSLIDSKRWFRETMNSMLYSSYRLSATNPRQFYAATSDRRIFRASQIKPGSLYCWFYNPKYRNKLPYYDRFPVAFILNMYRNGFLGINLHYLPVRQRAVLMTRLVDNMLRKSSSGDYLDLQYRTLMNASRYAELQPCIKRYLINQIQGQMIEIQPTEWMKAIFLPLESFAKQSRNFVWQQSRQSLLRRR